MTINKLSKSDRILLEKVIKARAIKDRSSAMKTGQTYEETALSPVDTNHIS